MIYFMALVIVGADNTAITVVTGPVAHQRGGASPVPRVDYKYNTAGGHDKLSVNGQGH
jgi:hypothetical protein